MLSTNPYKGTKDFYPRDQLIQNFIFEKWKKISQSHSFEEYQTPIIEPAEIYEAKSGEDVGNKELFTFSDLAERKLCLRPEMTPSVTRIVAARYKELPKPIKYFSIGSFYRNERPQKGRNREFWQINADIFGDNSIYSDIEVLTLALDIMEEFQAPANSYTLYINHRELLNDFYNLLNLSPEIKISVTRIVDKFEKLSLPVFHQELAKYLSEDEIKKVEKFLSLNTKELIDVFPFLNNSKGFEQINLILETLNKLGYEGIIKFKPSLVRGFDYYDGLVFEVFDNNPENNSPAVGFAVGNETFRIFLENWDLIPENRKLIGKKQIGIFAVKNSSEKEKNQLLINQVFIISREIRKLCPNIIIDTFLESKSPSAGLELASNKNYEYCLIIGEDEINDKKITIKEMGTGSQKTLTLHELISFLKQLPYEIN